MAALRDSIGRLWRRRPVPLEMREGYARWAPVYPDRPHNAVMAAEASAVGPLVRTVAARRALDVGTGTGRNLALLRSTGARLVVGVDLSAAMLAHVRMPERRVRGDARRLPFGDGTFDVATSSLMCGDVEDLRAWVAEASRVLREGGHLVYSDFHPSWSRDGWRRTFTGADGRAYQLPLHPHSMDDHVLALEGCGLDVKALVEPRSDERKEPLVVVFHAVKRAAGPC